MEDGERKRKARVGKKGGGEKKKKKKKRDGTVKWTGLFLTSVRRCGATHKERRADGEWRSGRHRLCFPHWIIETQREKERMEEEADTHTHTVQSRSWRLWGLSSCNLCWTETEGGGDRGVRGETTDCPLCCTVYSWMQTPVMSWHTTVCSIKATFWRNFVWFGAPTQPLSATWLS